ncbi:GNAT family N-acetyltransferase [Acidianus manzaensis]|uniref:GNAT family N-acetyltransferase n=1 Tax=Acidianus manzaensis TaxID=282676 RepID=A0A1W6K314_9CREN|nr:GNAT family N-acetyltransferase [Acidianus manzaensis]ARM76842.1 GNAT family N-acetyltransferase [Acidianus manzaensis]
MLEVKIRRALPEDVEKIFELYNSLSEDDLYLRYFHYYKPTLDEMKTLVKQSDHITLVAESDGKIIGEGTLYNDGEFSLVVAQEFRKQGVGTEIVKALIEEAKNKKLKNVRFYTLPENEPMIRIGKKLNFKLSIDEDEVYGELKLS